MRTRREGRCCPAAVAGAAILGLLLSAVAGSAELVPNSDFSAGSDAPDGWQLVGGGGRWVDRDLLEVSGTGRDSSYWRCHDLPFTPAALYRFEFLARRASGSGSAIAGPAFANRDYSRLADRFQWQGHIFRVPDGQDEGYLRLGQWHATGAIQFGAVRLGGVLPAHRAFGELILGEGESIRGAEYRFHGTFGGEGSNYHRTLDDATASFNSNRWCFDRGSRVTYRFDLPGRRFLAGSFEFNVNYHTRGGCIAEASRDGAEWHPLASQNAVGSATAELPPQLLPADALLVRLRSEPPESSFQVDRVELVGLLDSETPEIVGQTRFLDVHVEQPGLAIDRAALRGDVASGRITLELTVRNSGSRAVAATLGGTLGEDGEDRVALAPQSSEIPPGGSATMSLDVSVRKHGRNRVELVLAATEGRDGLVRASLQFSVPEYYRTDYGRLVAGGTGGTAVWWCDATRKIPRRRPAPVIVGRDVELAAAGNDFEAVQIVVRASEPLKGLTAKINPPAVASPEAEILRVDYHFVDHPTDATGVRDWWPDALPPLSEPIDVPAETNQPLWVLFYVPKEAEPGDHWFELTLEAKGFAASVPIKLHVWDFSLPRRNHLETAFGLSASTIFRYHQLESEEDKRKVLDMYLKSFAEHRISLYDPAPLDSIEVRFLPEADPPQAEVDFTAFDRGMEHALVQFPFTNFRLPIQGMGGGSFHARYEPKIGSFGEDTPEYQAMFSSYVTQVEEHLRHRGWLDEAFIYWFDEPDPKDYQFVRSGMERLKRHAPGLQTMLTEEPCDELAGPIDIWCPVTPNYDPAAAEKRQAEGERFWWYVCTGPKAPYCTLFIDHPATELRVWLWQTWQRDIRGILVWSSNYWTSSAAYPDEPQDPYEDPMGYRSGYSTPRGVKAFWGNGDGRFVYPPPAAAVPGASGPDPVIAPPVSSIRWEMLREGIEDYEYLYRLRELLDGRRDRLPPERIAEIETLMQVPESITADMTTFTTDPAPIYARRRQIAEAIEELSK